MGVLLSTTKRAYMTPPPFGATGRLWDAPQRDRVCSPAGPGPELFLSTNPVPGRSVYLGGRSDVPHICYIACETENSDDNPHLSTGVWGTPTKHTTEVESDMDGGPVREAGGRHQYEHFGAAVGLWRHARRRALDAPGAERMRDTSIFRGGPPNIELSVSSCSL